MPLIVSKYNGRCRTCRNPYRVGDRVYWYRGIKGAQCRDCGSPDSSTPPIKSQPERPPPEKWATVSAMTQPPPEDAVIVEWSEVKAATLHALDGECHKVFNAANGQRMANLVESDWTRSWIGGTFDEVREWITKGYKSGNIEANPQSLITPRKRRRATYGEEGELQLDLAYSGFDYPFLEWEQRERKPGMAVEIGMAFASQVDNKLITAYQKWCGEVLSTLETLGYDLELSLRYDLYGAHGLRQKQESAGCREDTRIRVKRVNEAIDPKEWSSLFSPAGFRTLGFTAITLAAQKVGGIVHSTWGMCVTEHWGVSWNADKRILKITPSQLGGEFPAARMTDDFNVILNQIGH